MHKEAMKNFREGFEAVCRDSLLSLILSEFSVSFLKAVIVSFINRVVEDDNAAVLQ